MTKKISISDIAEALQMSKNTVSKALNGQYVPEKTRLLVFNKAKELNYKSMKYISNEDNKSYHLLLLSGKPLSNINYFSPILRTIENLCYERKHQLFQHVALEEEFHNKSFEYYLENIKIDGIICIECFSNTVINKILDINIPTVFIDFSIEEVKHDSYFDVIEPDNFNALYNYLNNKIKSDNLSDISFIGDPNHCLSFKERCLAMYAALSENKINHDFNKDICFDDDNSLYGSPLEIKGEMIRRGLSPLYVCGNDYIALNVIKALELMHKNVPNDVQVIGFDNSLESKASSTQITTFDVKTEELARTTLFSLIHRIKFPKKHPTKILINTNVITRDSTK